MKIPNLRAKFKPKGCKGNLHFGKIVLALMLICLIMLNIPMPICADTQDIESNFQGTIYGRGPTSIHDYFYIGNHYSYVTQRGAVMRGFLSFDTSAISDNDFIDEVILEFNDCEFEARGNTYVDIYLYDFNRPLIISDWDFTNKGAIWIADFNYSNLDQNTDKISVSLPPAIIKKGDITNLAFKFHTESNGAYDSSTLRVYGSKYLKISYITNKSPNLTLSTPIQNSYFGKEKPINISGTVKDTDSGDTLTIKYTISGITAHTNKTLRTITANGNNQSFSNNISIDTSIPEGSYDLKVWVEDNNGGKSSEVTRKINVDKTPPNVPSLNLDESWTNKNRTFTITGGDDSGSGLDRLEYKIGDGSWTFYSGTTTALSDTGTITVYARAIDKVGNISGEVSKVAKVDKIKPTVDISNNDDLWHAKDITVNIQHSDTGGSGVATKRYAVTNSMDKPNSGWINIASNNQDIVLSNDGYNFVHVQVIDNAGNETYVYKGPFKIDKTPPILNDPVAEAISSSEIKISVDAKDNLSGLDTKPYLYNRDGNDISDWSEINILEDKNLEPNRQYVYKYKARDSIGNVSEYSNVIYKYTKALNPEKIILKEVTGTSLTFEVVNDSRNINTPETILRLDGVGDTGWSTDKTKSFSGLEPGRTCKLSINTRNGDKEDNGWLNVPGDIPIEDEFGNPVTEITTIIPVENFKVVDSSVNTLTVSWNAELNQEYEVYLKDESGNEVPNTRSGWFSGGTYTFTNLPSPNTRYVPYIITRRVRSATHLAERKVLNDEKAYTNAKGISRGVFESGEDYIIIRLNIEDTNNPNDTEYHIKNDITEQEVIVRHDNPMWKNTNLAKESYYTYSVRVVNKNGEPSYYTRLVFENGEAHTLIPDLDIDPGNIIPDNGDFINLDDLKEHDLDQPIWFNPEEDLNNNIVQLESEKYRVTRNRIEVVENHEEIEVINYSYSREGFGYTDWKPLEKGKFKEKLIFNTPGIYRTHWKFKNYNIESKPVIINYYADWIEPSIDGESAIKGQTAVTGNEFRVRINAKDNISPYLFYSIDDGKTWYLLKEGQNEIVFTNIKKSPAGVQNKLTVKVADIAGNVVQKTFTVWGIEK